jgi:hypothetical protein
MKLTKPNQTSRPAEGSFHKKESNDTDHGGTFPVQGMTGLA